MMTFKIALNKCEKTKPSNSNSILNTFISSSDLVSSRMSEATMQMTTPPLECLVHFCKVSVSQRNFPSLRSKARLQKVLSNQI